MTVLKKKQGAFTWPSITYGLLLFILATFSASQTLAEESEELEAESEEEFIGKIDVVATGTRLRTRSVHDSPAPIDIIRSEELRNQGSSDLVDLVRNVVPSFNVNTQPISDASTLVRPINLRGLPSDHTLVLVNGKRRHRASVIHWNSGNGAAEGAQGPDISVIPAIALKRLEVLRDGASAQYGSDAIAGVMNFILKDDAEGGALEVKYGQYSEDSNESAYTIAGNIGLPFTSRGFVNASFEYSEADDTDRSQQRSDAATLIEAGNMDVKDPVQLWGSPEINDDLKTFFNLGLELDDSKEFYMFGNYASKEVDGGFYFRNPGILGGGRKGVFVDSSGVNHLIGDLNPGDSVDCSTAVDLENYGGLPDYMGNEDVCYTHLEKFPGGFVPRFGADMEDASLVAGLRGELDNGFSYDLSASFGYNDADFFLYNTLNSSMGRASPTSFDPGDYTQTEYSFNADFSYPVEIESFASDLNVSSGLEYRVEDFEITAGETASWEEGELVDQGFSPGSNGFPGFSPDIAGDWERENYAAYLDLEADVTDNWLVGAAMRFEDFEDFGSTTNGKLSTRFDISDRIALRATWSTGFRAPTPGQTNASNISTTCKNLPLGGCELVNEGVIPANSAAAQKVGASEPDEEEATNWGIGLVFRGQNWGMTIDYFNIEVDDRIALSRDFQLNDEQRAELVAEGFTGAVDLRDFRFYTNGLDTETKGVDVVISHSREWAAGVTDLNLAYNYTDTEVSDHDPDFLNPARIKEIEENLPDSRMNITANHKMGDWRFMLRYNWTDEWFDGEAGETFDDYWTLDAEAGYSLNNGLTLLVGGTNVTDETPDKTADPGAIGTRYSQFAPLGSNGAFYYGRITYDF